VDVDAFGEGEQARGRAAACRVRVNHAAGTLASQLPAWSHRSTLVPRRLVAFVCDRMERWFGSWERETRKATSNTWPAWFVGSTSATPLAHVSPQATAPQFAFLGFGFGVALRSRACRRLAGMWPGCHAGEIGDRPGIFLSFLLVVASERAAVTLHQRASRVSHPRTAQRFNWRSLSTRARSYRDERPALFPSRLGRVLEGRPCLIFATFF
jgi:hypothetical protein